MPVNRKIVAAVATAVGEFLMAEVSTTVSTAAEMRPLSAPFRGYSPWTLSGRRSMMDMRRFLQLRLTR